MSLETTGRAPLTRGRIFATAVALADQEGLEALTMRRLAQELGVEAMSLYHHVDNKEALLDGMVEAVVAEINQAVGGVDRRPDWLETIRERILTARRVMLRHRWAPAVLETRTRLSLETMRYYDSLAALFRSGGFSYDLIHHAMHALGSRALGFTQELFDPGDGDEAEAEAENNAMLEEMAGELPYLVEMLIEIAHDDPETTLGWCDDQAEFEFGLDIILEGLERRRRGS